MLNVTAVEVENYISFGARQRLEVGEPGIHLLKGYNLDSDEDGRGSVGSGKSSLMSAVDFVVFGDVRDRFKKKDGVVNKKAGANCMAAFEGVDGAGTTWRAERYRRHSVHKDGVRLLRMGDDGWVDETLSTASATQERVRELFGVDRELYRRSAMLTRDNMAQFLSFGERERASLFESLLHAEELGKFAKRAKTMENSAASAAKAINAELGAINDMNRRLAAGIVAGEEKWKAECDGAKSAVEALERAYEEANGTGMSANEIIDAVEASVAAEAAYKAAAGAASELARRISQLEKLAADADDAARRQTEAAALARAAADGVSGVVCKSCGEDVDPEGTKALVAQKLAVAEAYEDSAGIAAGNAATYRAQIEEAKASSTAAKEEVERTGKILAEAAAAVPPKARGMTPDEVRAAFGVAETELLAARETLAKLEASKPDSTAVKDAIRDNKRAYAEKQTELAAREREAAAYGFWRNALDLSQQNSVRQYMMETVVPAFNAFLQENLDRLWPGIRVTFDTSLRETITFDGESYDPDEFSTGERTRIDLAINMAMFDMIRLGIGEARAIFMDEIFTNVDEPTTGAFLSLIRDKYARSAAVYIATHQTYVTENADPVGVLSVVKENGVSRLHVGDLMA